MRRVPNEGWCDEVLRSVRWPDGVACPLCHERRVTVHSRSRRTPRRKYLCLECHHTFTDLSGTVFVRGNLLLGKWFLGLSLLAQGLATAEYARALGVKWDTARRLSRRLVVAASTSGLIADLLSILASDGALAGAAQRGRAPSPGEVPGLRKWLIPFVPLLVGFWGCLAWAQGTPGDGPTQRGKALYETYCAFCHGPDGRADTTVGRILSPRPRNFADPVEMARLSEDRMYRAIKEGVPGTAMAGWGQVLTEPQVGDVMDYLRTFAAAVPTPPVEQLSLEIGRRIYQKDCAFCHGADGRADTDAARVFRPRPRDFTDSLQMARVDDGRMYAAIKMGRPGTAMASWGELLTPAEVIHVMRYIRTLQRPLPDGLTPAEVDLRVGGQIYGQHCRVCHGERGDGRTPLGLGITPRPRDFSDAKEMSKIPDDDLGDTIRRGSSGTAMAAWGGILNEEDIRRVVLYIRRTFAGKP